MLPVVQFSGGEPIMTSKELAEILGVSTAAVSLALNGKKGISQHKRETIIAAAKAHGIKINAQTTFSKIGYLNLVIFKKHGLVYGDTAFFSELIEAIGHGVTKAGYNLQMTYFYGNQDRKEQIQSLITSECAGIILLATEMATEDFAIFEEIEKPLVFLDSYEISSKRDSVVINNAQGAFIATRYLIENGHDQFGYVHGRARIHNFIERYSGFKMALKTGVGQIEKHAIVHIDVTSTQEGAYQDMLSYLKAGKPLARALFVENDLMAMSCIRALMEYGFSIPDDISVIGFDDIPTSYLATKKLSTIRVPRASLGMAAVKLLDDRIKGRLEDSSICTRINTELCPGDTVKNVRVCH